MLILFLKLCDICFNNTREKKNDLAHGRKICQVLIQTTDIHLIDGEQLNYHVEDLAKETCVWYTAETMCCDVTSGSSDDFSLYYPVHNCILAVCDKASTEKLSQSSRHNWRYSQCNTLQHQFLTSTIKK